MTTAELNQFLENIAKLIEATADDPATAAIARSRHKKSSDPR